MNQLSVSQLDKHQEEHLLVLADIPYGDDLEYFKLEQINELIQAFMSAQDARQTSNSRKFSVGSTL